MRVPVCGARMKAAVKAAAKAGGKQGSNQPSCRSRPPSRRASMNASRSRGATRRAFRTRTCASSPRAASRYTLAVQTPRCAATSRTDSSASRPPGSTPSAGFACSKGAAKIWRSGASGGTRWTAPPIPPLTKSVACDAELPPATPADAPGAHSQAECRRFEPDIPLPLKSAKAGAFWWSPGVAEIPARALRAREKRGEELTTGR
jgi:hypothetical protein